MNEYNQIIYKKDTKGKIRFLEIDTNNGELIQRSGLVDGKTTERSKMCKPKNIGKANETTSEEQAVLQAKSKIKEKLRSGYFLTEKEAEDGEVILPMLAKSYKTEVHKIDWSNCYIQPKFDGQRALIFVKESGVEIISRTGVPITTMDHIEEEVYNAGFSDGTILDGELYIHGLSFQENMKLIKKKRKGSDKVKFHWYDIIHPDSFKMRNIIMSVLKPAIENLMSIESVPTFKVNSEENVRKYHEDFVSLGYEGSMIRWGEEHYKVNGRSSCLLKNKDFIDIAIPIKDIVPGDADPLHGYPVFLWEGARDNELASGVKGTHEYRQELLANKDKYIGLTAEVRFFEYSDTGVPRFPVMVGIRNDK